MPLSLFLLGPPRVEIDGEVIAFPRQKSLALLAYLAVTGEQQRRDSLAALLWPESADARGSLRRELSSLKSALGDGDWLDADRENITLAGDVWLDVDGFLAAVEGGDPGGDPTQLTRAADHYRGDFLTGFSLADAPDFDDWCFFQSEEYRRIFAGALERLIAHHQKAGEPDDAIPFARRLLALDNLHEPAHRILMRLYALAGQQAAALRQYDECVRLLDEELGVPPEDATSELHEAIRTRRFPAEDDKMTRRQGDTLTSPPHPVTPSSSHLVLPSPLHNLPPQATPFVGRQREVAEVERLLAAPNARLVTITGVGGIGKSRLGLVVAEKVLADFPDGVWFVPLAQVEAADGVPRAIAAALSLSGGGESRSSLLTFLHDKHLLLLLDNFEHLLDGADFLAELLPSAPGVKLLVTSQERLNLLEESLFPLGGLDEAARLFVERAQRVQPDFDPAAEGEAIGAICRLVEGMPLAIELAASWVRVMACTEIAAEIERSADFLASNLRNLPTRHRSLRALFERSWALLDPDEGKLLARLSVFQGGFTRQAAQIVADATPRQLAGLVDHSFLRRQTGERFDMHGLMHRFAAEQLAADSGVETDARQRHAEFYADLVIQAGWELEPGDPAASAAADRDGPNVLAAWRWGVENRDASVMGRMMRWLVGYYQRLAGFPAGEVAFTSAIEAFRSADGRAANPGLIGALLLRLGKCIPRDRFDLRPAVMRESVSLLRQAEPVQPLDLAQALVWEGMSHASQGRNPEGAVLMEEGIALFRTVGNDLGVGTSLRDLGILQKGWGRLRESQAKLEEAIQLLTGAASLPYVQSTAWLGDILVMRGHYRRAEALLRRALPFAIDLRHNMLTGNILLYLGEVYTATGDFGRAKRHFADAHVGFDATGMGYLATFGICHSPAAMSRLAGDEDAEAQLLDAVTLTRQVNFEQRIATSLHHLARLRHDQRDYEGALSLLDEALTIARKIDFRYATALVLTAQGHSLLALKQPDAARAAYTESLDIAYTEGIDRIACDALSGIAQLRHQRGDSQLALSLLHFAHTHEASEWETKRRAERLLSELPQSTTHPPIPSLEEAIRLARAALDETAQSPNQPITQSPIHLPTTTTSFIGREGELSELTALLTRPDVRLATVVASGGMGKTRFAIEAARRLAGDYPDGVWFLPLVGVSEANQMLSALVQLLDAPMGAGGAKEAVLRFLARRRLLLVLDNFEQLVNSADVLAEIVQGAPDVKLLVTSRVRLNLREEWAFPLVGLGMEAVVTDDTATLFAGPNEAIRLFVERAQQMQPSFDAAAEAEAMAAICRAVEGMPLGIELAASWLRAMKCGEIAVEIRRDADFLSTPLRNVPAHHRSMRAVFERSWGLLTAEEQRGLARLSVFQGGFTRAAAEAVADVHLPMLSALVDHSLLRHSDAGRYDVHELLRQFAAEQLEESGKAESTQDKHSDYFLSLLAERTEDMQWRHPKQALDGLIPERENVFVGWRWACQRALFPQIQGAAFGLLYYCNWTNTQESGRQLFDRAIEVANASADVANDRSGILGSLQWKRICLEHLQNQTRTHLSQLTRSRELLVQSESDHREEIAVLDLFLSAVLSTVGRNEEAVAYINGAILIFTETGNRMRLGHAYYWLALVRSSEAVALADEAYRKADEEWRKAKAPPYPMLWRCIVYQMQGMYIEQLATLERAKAIGDDPFTRERNTNIGLGPIENQLGEVSISLGRLDRAAKHFQLAQNIYEAEGQSWVAWLGLKHTLGTLLRLRGAMGKARQQIEIEVATVRSVGFGQRIAARLHELARLEYDEGRYAHSEAALAEALAIAESIDFRFIVALVLCQMGHTAAIQGKPEAAGFYRRALEIAREQGMNGIVVDVIQGVAGLAAQGGDVTNAVEWLALAASHPNGEWETKQKARKALTELEGRLSAEEFSSAQVRGQSAALETVIPSVLARLA